MAQARYVKNKKEETTMKKFLSLVLALCMVMTLCSCALAEDVTLSVWVGDNLDMEWINKVIENFKAANPDKNYTIKVDVVGEGDAKSTVLKDVEAAADVYTFADDQFNDLAAQGALQKLDEVMDVTDVIAADGGAESGSVLAASMDGELYAFPATASNGYFMFYNKEYFTEEDVQTLDGMLEKAAAAGKYVGIPMNDAWYLYGFFKGAGLTMGLAEGSTKNNVCNWNATDTEIKGVDVLEALLTLAKNPGFRNAKSEDFVTGVKDGSIVAGISGTWNATVAQEAWGDNYAAVKLPTYTVAGKQVQMASFAGYKMVGVNPYSADVFSAAEFAAFMTNYDSQVLRFQLRSEGPANVEAAASDAVKADPAISALAAQSAYANVQRVGDNYWSNGEALGQLIVLGNPDGKALQTILDDAVTGITTPVAD